MSRDARVGVERGVPFLASRGVARIQYSRKGIKTRINHNSVETVPTCSELAPRCSGARSSLLWCSAAHVIPNTHPYLRSTINPLIY